MCVTSHRTQPGTLLLHSETVGNTGLSFKQTSSYKTQTLAQDAEKSQLYLIKGMKIQLTQEGPLCHGPEQDDSVFVCFYKFASFQVVSGLFWCFLVFRFCFCASLLSLVLRLALVFDVCAFPVLL